ncbi:MAG: zf-HC2 domain-containing protein [Candidatus Solibacter sp.]
MTKLSFDEWACRDTQAKLDAYIDGELLVETNLELGRHFERCETCAREAAVRREVCARVRVAVRLTPVPDGLESRLRSRLRNSGGEQRIPWRLMAIAALIVLSFGSWFTYERSMLRIGARNHLHCAVIRQGIRKPVGQDKLASEYKPILAAAREQAPPGMYLTVAHECTFEGRKFVHVTFRDDSRLLSVLVTRKGSSEFLPGDLHDGHVDGFQAAAFQTGGYLVYTISDLSRQENLRILAAIAPAIKSALHKGESA